MKFYPLSFAKFLPKRWWIYQAWSVFKLWIFELMAIQRCLHHSTLCISKVKEFQFWPPPPLFFFKHPTETSRIFFLPSTTFNKQVDHIWKDCILSFGHKCILNKEWNHSLLYVYFKLSSLIVRCLNLCHVINYTWKIYINIRVNHRRKPRFWVYTRKYIFLECVFEQI